MDQNDLNLIKEVVAEAVKSESKVTNTSISDMHKYFSEEFADVKKRLTDVELTMATKKDVNDLREEMRYGSIESRKYISNLLRDHTKFILESTCSKPAYENLKVHVEVLKSKVHKSNGIWGGFRKFILNG